MCHQLAFWYKVLDFTIPKAVTMTGGVYLWKDGREVPDTMSVTLEQPAVAKTGGDCLISWNSGFGNNHLGSGEDVLGTDGTLRQARGQTSWYPERVNVKDRSGSEGHLEGGAQCAHAELPRRDPHRRRIELPVRTWLPHGDRLQDGCRQLPAGSHHEVGPREGRDRVTRGELARALTRAENGIATPPAGALKARIFGITGAPGAGKSTLVAAMIGDLRRRGLRVGVLAVDPSSPFTGGALLGDRIRMGGHENDDGVFIRSMASRGATGGLAPATAAAAAVLAAAGFEIVLIETVGVGQSEVDVSKVADRTAVVLTPGMGDDVQAGKAGILEIADLLVLNKADLPGAALLEKHLREELEAVPLLKTVASTGEGVPELVEHLLGVG